MSLIETCKIPDGCLSVVMPAFNEEKTIEQVIATVLAEASVGELVVVDDASLDGTAQVVKRLAAADSRIRFFQHEKNRGKGGALATGFEQVSLPIVIIQDADAEYDPAEYNKLLAPICAGYADVVFGSRFLGSGAHRVLYFWHYVANFILTLSSNIFTNLNLSDMECCYKVFRLETLKRIQVREQRFGVEPELAAKVARLKVSVFEIGISYRGRTYEEGKKIGWKDAFRALYVILKYGLFRNAP